MATRPLLFGLGPTGSGSENNRLHVLPNSVIFLPGTPLQPEKAVGPVPPAGENRSLDEQDERPDVRRLRYPVTMSPLSVTRPVTEPANAPLLHFVDWVKQYVHGEERAEAQIFLDRFFQALGHGGILETGGTPEFKVRRAKDSGGGVGFADYVWKPVVLIEMKRRGTHLSRWLPQAFSYWTRLAPDRPSYVILCNFDEFWIYDFNRQLDEPVERLRLADLPNRLASLSFLTPERIPPVFSNDHESVTRDAAVALAECYRSVATKAGDELAQRFSLQMLVALFAQNTDLLPVNLVTGLLQDCDSPQSAFDLLGTLFRHMNTRGVVEGGRYKGVRYFNGGLFSAPAAIELDPAELALLRQAASFDWSKVRPEIFGTLFEQTLKDSERRAFGAHYTSPVDIMKVVGPTIVDPWRERIENANTLADFDRLLSTMLNYRVLDPACGSGNFLYVAYRELKRLESQLLDLKRERRRSDGLKNQGEMGFVSTRQFFGIDINEFAVELAKATLVIAHQHAILELKLGENGLPLDNLDGNFIAGDALLASDGSRRAWPPADVVIGNPPFLGAKRIKPERGGEYAKSLRKAYPEVPGMADYCVHWIRRTHDHLPPCTLENPLGGRAGLVGTQNIRNNRSRAGGLDYVCQSGEIVDAVENQTWSGDANVHVSIVNWIKTQDPALFPAERRLWKSNKTGLDLQVVPKISSALSSEADVSGRKALDCNRQPKRCFQGKIPGYDGFLLMPDEAHRFLPECSPVLVPYLTGRELLDPFEIRRWAIDFGNCNLEQANHFGPAFAIVRERVLPKVREAAEEAAKSSSDMAQARGEHLDRWWQFWNRRDELSRVLKGLPRYAACSRVSRRPIIAFLSSQICPSDLVQVFAFADDYSFGILQSVAHFEWYRTSSRLKVESDLRYSVREVFETFPWPQGPMFLGPTPQAILGIAEAARDLREVRRTALDGSGQGLRDLYRALELPGRSSLKDAQASLDERVRDAYGFGSGEDVRAGLLALNQSISARAHDSKAVVSPGIPPSWVGSTDPLFSTDCYLAENP